MEKELCCFHTFIIRIPYKAFGFGGFGVSGEVGQGTISEPIRHSIAIKNLLAYTADHLAEVDKRSFASTGEHHQRGIVDGHGLSAEFT